MTGLLLAIGVAWGTAQGDYEAGVASLRAGEHAAAIAHLQDALAAGGEDPAVYHALGNALYREGALGEAMAAWRRGLALSPGDADLLANLERAQSLTRDRLEPPQPAVGPFFWLRWMSARVSGVLASVAATLGMGMLIGVQRTRQRRLAWAAGGALLAAALLAGSAWQASQVARTATVVAEEVAAHSTPAEGGVALFVLHEGAEVRVIEEPGEGAVLVGLSDGRKGWLPQGTLRSTVPGDPFPATRNIPESATEE